MGVKRSPADNTIWDVQKTLATQADDSKHQTMLVL